MGRTLRLSEKWFRRGLWLVALVFAGFLIGLGGAVVGDLPRVQEPLKLDDFMDLAQVAPLRERSKALQKEAQDAQAALEQARLGWERARSQTQAQRETLGNWLAARSATQRAETDPEVMARTQALDALKQQERSAQQAVQAQEQGLLDARQEQQAVRQQLQELEREGRKAMEKRARHVQLQVFLYRLALALPMLVVAGWLFVKKRKSPWWPFVWGFIFFALFTFFVELVPYLPSYGGYVRSVVGLVVTVLVGRYAIAALRRYLQQQQLAESLPDAERRRAVDYDEALARWSKNLCPGCERPVELKDGVTDFCPHCGMGLFCACGQCGRRRSAFTRYCFGCGSAQAQQHEAAQA